MKLSQLALGTFAVLVLAAPSHAQRGGRGGGRGGGGNGFSGFFGCTDPPLQNIPYDGQFTFARIKYNGGPGTCYYRGEPSWAHGYGYPVSGTAESNLMQILSSISGLRPHLNGTNVLAIDDPLLFKYPIAFMVETGYLTLSDKEATALRKYLMKGGFLIIDDSREDFNRGINGWANTAAMMQKVFPDLKIIDMDPKMPVFHSFFEIPSFDIVKQDYDRGPPIFKGIFQNNDPTQRQLVMINFNTDISNFWEFSPTGTRPVDASNEAFKLGVNYFFYGLIR